MLCIYSDRYTVYIEIIMIVLYALYLSPMYS